MYWKKEIKNGLTYLSKHELRRALKCFEAAVTDCPVSSKAGLDKSLFYLGVTFSKLGRDESALRCWHIAGKLFKDGLSKKMIQRHSNLYGMAVNKSTSEEDRMAFSGIQIEKYLKKKKVNRFCSDAEKDVVYDIINDYWSEILSSGLINHLSLESKIIFFRNQILIFPFSSFSSFEDNSMIIFTNFQSGQRLSMTDLCSCGSGLLFSQCCGRIKTIEELEIGQL